MMILIIEEVVTVVEIVVAAGIVAGMVAAQVVRIGFSAKCQKYGHDARHLLPSIQHSVWT